MNHEVGMKDIYFWIMILFISLYSFILLPFFKQNWGIPRVTHLIGQIHLFYNSSFNRIFNFLEFVRGVWQEAFFENELSSISKSMS